MNQNGLELMLKTLNQQINIITISKRLRNKYSTLILSEETRGIKVIKHK